MYIYINTHTHIHGALQWFSAFSSFGAGSRPPVEMAGAAGAEPEPTGLRRGFKPGPLTGLSDIVYIYNIYKSMYIHMCVVYVYMYTCICRCINRYTHFFILKYFLILTLYIHIYTYTVVYIYVYMFTCLFIQRLTEVHVSF